MFCRASGNTPPHTEPPGGKGVGRESQGETRAQQDKSESVKTDGNCTLGSSVCQGKGFRLHHPFQRSCLENALDRGALPPTEDCSPRGLKESHDGATDTSVPCSPLSRMFSERNIKLMFYHDFPGTRSDQYQDSQSSSTAIRLICTYPVPLDKTLFS